MLPVAPSFSYKNLGNNACYQHKYILFLSFTLTYHMPFYMLLLEIYSLAIILEKL